MVINRRVLLMVWIVALAAGLLVTIGLPAAFTLLTDFMWWR
jgi:hypothetical protein